MSNPTRTAVLRAGLAALLLAGCAGGIPGLSSLG